MPFEIDISGSSEHAEVLRAAVERGLEVEGVTDAILSVTVVDNARMRQLNAEHLDHDYPTDVISFQLEWTCSGVSVESRSHLAEGRSEGAAIEGEIIVSAEYAAEMAVQCGWSVQNELILYTIHGMLHICGYDDLSKTEKEVMRSRERAILQELGLTPEYPADVAAEDDEPPPGSGTSDRTSRGTAEGCS